MPPPDDAPDRRAVWRLDHPVEVTVDLDATPIRPRADRMIGHSPLWLQHAGAYLYGEQPGLLVAWIRSSNGGWLGVVEFPIRTRDGRVLLTARQVFDSRALRVAGQPRPAPGSTAVR